jgi:hypothetical protein
MISYPNRGTPRADLGIAIREHRVENTEFIGTKVLTMLPVMEKKSAVGVIPREETLKRANAARATGGTYNRVSLASEDMEYACEEHGLEAPLPDEQRSFYASDFDAELETSRLVDTMLLREQEIRIKDLVFNTTTWTGSSLYTDVSAAPWDSAASDALGHVRAAREKVRRMTGMEPDTMVIGKVTLDNLLANTAIIARLTSIKMATEEAIKQALTDLLGLKRILVGSGVYDATPEGGTPAITDIWADDYAFIAVTAAAGSILAPAVGRTILWTEDSPENITVDQYREEQTRSEVFRVRQHTDEKIIDAYFAHLLKVDA